MAIKIGSDSIGAIQYGSTPIKKIMLGKSGGLSDIIWTPKQEESQFVQELHYWNLDDSGATVDGLTLNHAAGGRINLLPPFTESMGKIYFEIIHLDGENREFVISDDDQIWGDYMAINILDSGIVRTYKDDSGDINSGNMWWFDDEDPNDFPVTRQICIDIPNKLFWNRLLTNDETDNFGWNWDYLASPTDPATGTGGIDISGFSWDAADISFWVMPYGAGSIKANFHAHQFRYAPPAGFSEMKIAGEYS